MDDNRIFNPLNLTLSRSYYDWENHSMGSCIVGRLIPAFTWDLLPGTEIKMDVESLFKMATPVYPTMDYLYADIAFFFVPYKMAMSRRYGTPSVNDKYESWEGFIGAQDFAVNTPVPASGVELPIISSGSAKYLSLCEYLYGPDGTGSDQYGMHCNALPLLAYFSIWNENYREPSLQSPVTWNYAVVGGSPYLRPVSTPQICICDAEVSSVRTGVSAGTYVDALDITNNNQDLSKSMPLPVSVFHGYFGSLLPWPQRNLTGITLPVGGFAPLVVNGTQFSPLGGAPLMVNGSRIGSLSSPNVPGVYDSSLVVNKQDAGGTNVDLYAIGSGAQSNLGVNLAATAGIEIEKFRALVVQQHWYEDLARSGNRLDELEYGTFGVRPKDSGCDRPMYLGGKRLQLNVEMVASTNGGTTSGPAAGAGSLGDLGAFSHTNDHDYYFHHAFDTWGALQCVFTIRCHNLIAGGVDRQWQRRTRENLYWPEFANLGNEAIYKKEIQSVTPAPGFGEQVLGYQEYAEEYRTPRDLVTGLLVPGRSLGFMTYAHRYNGTNGAVTLAHVLDASKQWNDVDRTLSVQQSASGFQFLYQMTFKSGVKIPVGKYVTPGLTRI